MCLDFCCGASSKKGLKEITKKRSCTDVLFLIMFIVSWIGVIVLVSNAVGAGGDPDKLLRGVDMYGKICGIDNGVKDKKYAMWPNPAYYDLKRCVHSCDETADVTSSSMVFPYETEVFVYYCLPTPDSAVTLSNYGSSAAGSSRGMADLYSSWSVVLISAFIALFVTYILLFVLQKIAGLVVLIGLVFLIIGGFLMGYGLYAYGADKTNNLTNDEATAAKVFGYIVFGLTILFALAMLFLRKRILIAVNVVEEAAIAINDMKMLLVFPIFPFIFVCGYFAFWIAGALWIWSVSKLHEYDTPNALLFNTLGQPTDNPATYKDYEIIPQWRYAAAYHFFHLLWNVQFLVYFNFLVAAGATADWYFTRRDDKGHKIRGFGNGELSLTPVLSSVIRTIRYHLGTIALCSLIIAIIQFIRACVEYIERKSHSKANKLQQCLFCCIRCCLSCLECCMDKVNKNALIWTAIYGDNFAVAACSSFELLWSNMGRVAAINVVTSILLSLTKVSIAIVTTGICGMMLTNISTWSKVISSPTVPCIVIFVVTYVVASLFMTTFHAVVDCIFLCFLIDEDTNSANSLGGNVEMFASDDLKKLVGKYQTESEKAALARQDVRGGRPGYNNANVVHVQPVTPGSTAL